MFLEVWISRPWMSGHSFSDGKWRPLHDLPQVLSGAQVLGGLLSAANRNSISFFRHSFFTSLNHDSITVNPHLVDFQLQSYKAILINTRFLGLL